MKISVRGDALNVRRPLMRVVRFHPGFAKVAFDWRGAVKRHADCDRRRCGIGGFGLLDYVRAVLAGIQFGAERVERRGKSLWICLEKKKQRRGGRDQGNDQPHQRARISQRASPPKHHHGRR
jgi:hypothetical protein